MNIGSPARRIVVLCVAVLCASQIAPAIAEELLGVWRHYGPGWCEDGALGVCDRVFRHFDLVRALVLAMVLAGLLVACWFGARWCLRPLRDLVVAIADIGPQNLGRRLRPGPGADDLAVLGRTIDDMMDRITVGYEAQRRFAADASHELRTPLAVQRTLIEVGMVDNLNADKLELLTAQLLATNERNERLIEGLLVLSESDRGLVARVPLRLDRIVAAVLDAHRPRAAEAGVTITSELRERVMPGEQVLLERLVTNLVQNALKYNRPDGTLHVEVGDDPALIVVNTGDDVPPEDVAALFEPFRRRAASRIDHSGGAGLGLSIARSITQAHGGVITASSTGRDGLRVEVAFPRPDESGDRGRAGRGRG